MTTNGSILVCDDDESITGFLEQILMKKGNHKVTKTHSGEECLKVWNNSFDVIILDYQMQEMNGLEVLKEIKKRSPLAIVIMATAHSSEKVVIESLRLGAYNYIKKPYDINYLLTNVQEAIFEANQRRMNNSETFQLKKSSLINASETTTKSPAVKEIIEVIKKVSQKNISILLTGSSGTGKEFFASLIYKLSNRSGENFVPVNCPAIPATLAESELFGHEKGSFTGAVAQKLGRFELANNGIIFLDEIADLSLEIQAKLLRVLQEREIYRVGGSKAIPINILLVSATSKDLRKEIDEGRFRADLYYRIADINVHIPKLHDRIEDIEGLSNYFILEYAKENNEQPKTFTEDAINVLKSYNWPGNIRELKSFIRKLMILVTEERIEKDTILKFFKSQMIEVNKEALEATQFANASTNDVLSDKLDATADTNSNEAPPDSHHQSISLKDMEKNLILKSITTNNGNLTLVAKELEMSRSTLYRKLKKYNIEIN
jgi:DNA-binding NtrC family response regulator